MYLYKVKNNVHVNIDRFTRKQTLKITNTKISLLSRNVEEKKKTYIVYSRVTYM